ncbi:MAG TPA: tRNA (N6-isopentenyl adenosine(37)-C2)-methylthiotransferase MiaB [Devosia sp.]|nr:tRNA (N6-isopentenyl adenosine(37)-C2)-methylthiotransferase MiaB [Devosia sp.]
MTETTSEIRPKRLFIKTYGCQMNVYDSDRMADALAPHGYEPTGTIEEADLVVLNTCHIREKASEKVFSELGRLAEMRTEGRDFRIAVAGCVAQAEGEEIARRAKSVDLVFGPQSYHRLPDLIARAERGERVIETDFPEEDKFAFLPAAAEKVTRSRGLTAFLTVQEGCDKFCSFCVVPYTRGAETSRPLEQVLAEARNLVEAGVREITLLGQNVNAWHGVDASGRELGLGALCEKLAELDGLARIRYTTSHPADMSDELIAAHRDNPKLMPWLHLPVQSGSDTVLKAMNRRHTRADYLRIIERIKRVRPDMAMSGDFIVGFPGETEADFAETLSIVREVGYASAFTFKYSVRPGTPGATLPDQIPEDVKTERLARLNELVTAQMRDFGRSVVGRTLDVLLEKKGRMPGQLGGRSPYLQAVHLAAPEHLIGQVLPVEIVAAGNNSIEGKIVTRPEPKTASLVESPVPA